MQLDRLDLTNFRNYAQLQAAFCPGVNLLVGDNAQGKTNLLEAIFYLCAGRSWRTRREQELLRFGADALELAGAGYWDGREQTLRALLFAGRRPRQLYAGGVKLKSGAQFAGRLTAVLFCPEDLSVLRGGSAGRRRLIDLALAQLRPGYAQALQEYGRLLDGKSRILRQQHEYPSLLEALPDYSQRMAAVGASLIAARARYLTALSEAAAGYHDTFSGGQERLRLQYHTVSTVSDPLAPRETIYAQLMEHMLSHERAERESGQCLSGPHKDDFEALLGELPVKTYGSQGQTRTCAISLKLAERELHRRDRGEEPLLLLDDVLSELDPARQDFVLNQIRAGQVFITCCEEGKLTRLGQVLRVAGGQLFPL